ncbi:unnamed protein product [Arabis nemorensis]|uniref:Thioredoxin domain-containing protein n=1 Tax=Arabis nemorensis TaxID=586526 RepID=A0A565BG86_9BRAS|nr:unnamed protein product [Arabis nemorensis]
MEKRVLYGLIVMLMYLVDGGSSQGEVKLISEEVTELEQLLNKIQQLTVVAFSSSFCGVRCAILDDQMDQLAKTYGNQITFYKSDISEKASIANLYKVVNVPTLIVFKGGKEIKRLEKDFYWGAVYDLIFKGNLFYSAPAPSESVPPAAPPSENMEEVENLEVILAETELPVVVTVTSLLCGVPCAILKDQMAQLAKTYGNKILLYTTDILENPFFAKLYEVLNVPTVIVFKDGKEIIRFEKLSDWSEVSDLIFESSILDSAPPPSDSSPALNQ